MAESQLDRLPDLAMMMAAGRQSSEIRIVSLISKKEVRRIATPRLLPVADTIRRDRAAPRPRNESRAALCAAMLQIDVLPRDGGTSVSVSDPQQFFVPQVEQAF